MDRCRTARCDLHQCCGALGWGALPPATAARASMPRVRRREIKAGRRRCSRVAGVCGPPNRPLRRSGVRAYSTSHWHVPVAAVHVVSRPRVDRGAPARVARRVDVWAWAACSARQSFHRGGSLGPGLSTLRRLWSDVAMRFSHARRSPGFVTPPDEDSRNNNANNNGSSTRAVRGHCRGRRGVRKAG